MHSPDEAERHPGERTDSPYLDAMKPFPFEITITPRLSETDMLGHINNTVPGIWYEAGRTAVLDLMLRKVPEFDQLMMAVRTEIDFLAEMFYGSDVTVLTGIERLGNSSVVYYQEAWQKDKRCGRARTTLVHVDRQARRSARLPDAMRDFMSQYLVEPGREPG